ncbi:MAG: phosphate acyltransferase PlsX [Kofleriaceae bacterium]|nr:phosphate acyltransferase PlsX [Myxococcales bacterium]MCB9564087.1 phosphate acyltransferase PlsX [Kofleriaceae bacterium]MCB9572545.1 phosphate acyltransferase PlsX [Kofleriaceae bacterium]
MIIALDAMGGDHAPAAEVAGALAAVRAAPLDVLLVGDPARLRAELRRAGATGRDRLEVVAASEVVTMDDHPAAAFRAKRDSSLRVAFDRVKAGDAAAVVSAGNSGAVLAHALFVLGRLPGVERPAICTVFPTPHGPVTLCDAGANVDVKPSMLAQFALLGAAYDRVAHHRARPRVGLLCNGTEADKGTELTRAAHALLAGLPDDAGVRYLGYVEGTALFRGAVDVIATDGFTGNVVLKTAEGLAEAFLGLVRRELDGTARGRVGAAVVAPTLSALRRQIHFAETGGALLVGVDGVVAVCHGRSDATAVKNGLLRAREFVAGEVVTRLAAAVRSLAASPGQGQPG